MKAAGALLSLLLLVSLAVPGGHALPLPTQVVHGQGEAVYWNDFFPFVDCDDITFDIVMLIDGDTAVAQIEFYSPTLNCITMAQNYAVFPSIVYGSWEEGWYGQALGAQEGPVQHWPVWDVVLLDEGYDGVYFWSYYVDQYDRQHWFEGEFDILTTT